MNMLQNKALLALAALFGAQPTSIKPTLPSRHRQQDKQQEKGRSEVAHLSKKELKKRKRTHHLSKRK